MLQEIGKVYVVNGAPASGKSFYVHEHRKMGDVILDVDHMNQCFSGADGLYDCTNRQNIGLVNCIFDFVLDKYKPIIYGGRNLWIITSEANPEKVNQLVAKTNAELIYLDVDVNTCKSRIKADDRRKYKAYWSHCVDQWFDRRENNLFFENKGLSRTETLDYYSKLKNIFDSLGVNYYLVGSLSAYLQYGVDFNRPYHDLDIYVDNACIFKIQQYCHDNNLQFVTIFDDHTLMSKVGHVCCIFPFEDSLFHVGLIPFMSCEDSIFSHTDFFYKYDFFHALSVHVKNDSMLCSYILSHDHILPYEYSMLFKLAYARQKDFDDLSAIQEYVDFDFMNKISNDILDSTYDLYLIKETDVFDHIEHGDHINFFRNLQMM